VLTDGQAFVWRQRLRDERAIRNITDTHVRILEFTLGAIEAGDDQLSHAAVAEALRVGVRTVGDTYRRAKALGLLGAVVLTRFGTRPHPPAAPPFPPPPTEVQR